MAKIRLKFTEEHLTLISALSVKPLVIEHPAAEAAGSARCLRRAVCDEDSSEPKSAYIEKHLANIENAVAASEMLAKVDEGRYCGIDTYDPFDGTDWNTAVAMASGNTDKMPRLHTFGEDDTLYEQYDEHTEDVRDYIMSNISHIESLVHQMCNKGGLKPGVTYVCTDRDMLWKEEKNN